MCVALERGRVVATTMLLDTQYYNLLGSIFLSSKLRLFSVLFYSYFHVQMYRSVYFDLRDTMYMQTLSQNKKVENILEVRELYFCLCIDPTALKNVIVFPCLNFLTSA